VDDVWTPPLADATAIVQKLRATQPDIVFYAATNFPDSIQVLQRVKEFSVKSPIQGEAAWLVPPEYVKTLGKETLDTLPTARAARRRHAADRAVAGRRAVHRRAGRRRHAAGRLAQVGRTPKLAGGPG